jgi:ribosomal protein S27E
MLTPSGIEIRQGESQWYPSSVVAEKFEQLADQGVYVRRSGQVDGPYTASRAVEVLQEHPAAEAREGKNGAWMPAPAYLSQLKNRALDGKKVRVQCPHCQKKLVMLATLAGKAANCPSCSRSFRVPGDAIAVDAEDTSAPARVATNLSASTDKVSSLPKASLVVSSANVKVISPLQPSVIKVVRPAAPTMPTATNKFGSSQEPTLVQGLSRPSGGRNTGSWNTDNGNTGSWNTGNAAIPVVPEAVLPPSSNPIFELDNFSTPSATPRPGPGVNGPGVIGPGVIGPGAAPAAPSKPSDRSVHYIIPGIFFVIWGSLFAIVLLIGFLRLGLVFWGIFNSDAFGQRSGQTFVSNYLFGFVLGEILGLICVAALAYIFITGGVAMLLRKRESLTMARTAAVCAAIPCLGLFIWPFGIWACFKLFSDQVKRDFK